MVIVRSLLLHCLYLLMLQDQGLCLELVIHLVPCILAGQILCLLGILVGHILHPPSSSIWQLVPRSHHLLVQKESCPGSSSDRAGTSAGP